MTVALTERDIRRTRRKTLLRGIVLLLVSIALAAVLAVAAGLLFSRGTESWPGKVRLAALSIGVLVFVAIYTTLLARLIKRRWGETLGRVVTYLILFTHFFAVVLPMVWTIETSVKPTSEIYESPFDLPKAFTQRDAGSIQRMKENYRKAWVESQFSVFFLNSVKVVSITMVASLAIACMAAYVLARFPFPGNRFLFIFFLCGMIIPGQLVIIPLFFEFTTLSEWLTTLFSPILAEGTIISLHDTHTGLILIYVTASLPFSIFILTNFFRTLPGELYEAGMVDGASEVQAFWHVMMPLAKPGIITVAIFNFIGIWNEYLVALIFINTEAKKTLPLGLASVSIQANYRADFGLLFAGLVIAMVPTLIVYLVLQERITKGITMGALKG